ncbi:hypothetical protein W97_06713 [Coniosporium apollinis CBS 100218]|uniref:14-3-3 domain-containing protein n=1 Tax=Coniosporium apollinis (strain CBS 100218) TaxID=1168221 RepID=R7Z084_CONA1|nr:uncharacterized protein W97_06713 [Coniosporium apollinis CBS 100218]EON67459.1 hypothetical protein W97_06713 [Coniosporium apollinis CBS 100218]
MASSDVDQKIVAMLAKSTEIVNPMISKAFYKILGLSVMLSRKLYRARKLRKLDTSRETKSLGLYHHIVWLSREGLTMLEDWVIPWMKFGDNQELFGPHARECIVMAAKLRASFLHIFCLFHNYPPVGQVINATTTSPTSGTSTVRRTSPPSATKPPYRNGSSNGNGNGALREPALRDPVTSILSDSSFVTNPYPQDARGIPPSSAVPPPLPTSRPPGLDPNPPTWPDFVVPPSSTNPGIATSHPPPGFSPQQPRHAPHRSLSPSFLLPAVNYIPQTLAAFAEAGALGARHLAGSHPLRLSIAVEHAAFLWDVVAAHAESRRLARQAIREVYRASEGITDAEFDDAAELVGVLGKMMKRRSWEGTPRVGVGAQAAGSGTSSEGVGGGAVPAGRRNGEAVPPLPTGEVRRSSAERERRVGSGGNRRESGGSVANSKEQRTSGGSAGRESRRSGGSGREERRSNGSGGKAESRSSAGSGRENRRTTGSR